MTSLDAMVAVVIATHNRSEWLPELIESLRSQDHPSFEVRIVDDGSTDDTLEVLRRLTSGDERFHIQSNGNQGPSAARNAAAAGATTEWLAFTDDDCLPQPTWLSGLLEVADSSGVDIVQGRTTSDPRSAAATRSWWARGKEVRSWSGRFQMCNLLARRSRVEEVDGFDERFPAHGFGEDIDIGVRMVARGATTAFAPDAVVHHRVLYQTYWEYLRRRYRWGTEVVRAVAFTDGARHAFRLRYVSHGSHVAFWLAVPISVAALLAGWWWLPPLAFCAIAAKQIYATRHSGRPLRVRIIREPLHLIGLGVQAVAFAIGSIRHRKLLV